MDLDAYVAIGVHLVARGNDLGVVGMGVHGILSLELLHVCDPNVPVCNSPTCTVDLSLCTHMRQACACGANTCPWVDLLSWRRNSFVPSSAGGWTSLAIGRTRMPPSSPVLEPP